MRLLPVTVAWMLAAASLLVAAAPRAAAPPGPVLLVTDVGDGAQRTLPSAVWRRLVTEALGGRNVTAEEGTALPDEARCRAAHAQYAVLATFDRAMRLPGLAQEFDRLYGVARFTVRNCATGAALPAKVVRVESEPLTGRAGSDAEANAQRAWESAIRTALAHDPLGLAPNAPVAHTAPSPSVAASTAVAGAIPSTAVAAPIPSTAVAGSIASPAVAAPTASSAAAGPIASPAVAGPISTTAVASNPTTATAGPTASPAARATRIARVISVEGNEVYVDNTGTFAQNQVLRAYADRNGKPYAQPVELVVLEISRRYVIAGIVGRRAPRVGDQVEPVPEK